ncbi:MAG: alpha/beta hydrolase family protein [Oscillospiraceae bacterium]
MAFIETSVYSQVLKQDMHVDLFLPNDRMDHPLKKPRAVIYFLHGMGSSEREFREYTAANRYARENHVAMVYPSAPQSFYNDMKYGLKYFTYLTEELPALLLSLFGVGMPREKTFVAGLSMGGYGALRLGLMRPDIYGGCAGFSGACDIRAMAQSLKENPVEDGKAFIPVFGEEMDIKDDQDLFCLAKKASELPVEKQPRVFMACGKQDDLFFLHDQNIKLKSYIQTLPIADFKYMEWDGVHDYSFWDRAMMHAISYFLNNGYDEKKIKLWRCEAE